MTGFAFSVIPLALESVLSGGRGQGLKAIHDVPGALLVSGHHHNCCLTRGHHHSTSLLSVFEKRTLAYNNLKRSDELEELSTLDGLVERLNEVKSFPHLLHLLCRDNKKRFEDELCMCTLDSSQCFFLNLLCTL